MLAFTRLMRLARSLAAALAAAALLAPLPAGPAYAQTITVTTTAEAPGVSGDCTLGEAIQAANSNSPVDQCPAGTSSDTIVLQAGATYTLTSGVDLIYYGPAAFVISSTITLQGNGAVLAHDPLAGRLRFFYAVEPASLTLAHLTLRGGRAQGADGAASTDPSFPGQRGIDGLGGAVLHTSNSALVLDGVTFQDNAAQGGRGGAGYSGATDTVGGAGGDAFGGAVYSGGSLTLLGGGAAFVGNQAVGGAGGRHGNDNGAGGPGGGAYGGALFAIGLGGQLAGPLTASDNAARGGGGAGLLVTGAGGQAYGGAIYLTGSTPAVLAGAVLFNNRAQGGRAASLLGGTRSGGESAGGGLYSFVAVSLAHGRVVSNTAQGGNGPAGGAARGGGLMIYTPYNPAGLTLTNTVVLSNTAAGGQGSALGQLGGAAGGGGVYMALAPLTANALAVVGNAAIGGSNPMTTTLPSALGGGLLLTDTQSSLTNLTLARNTARVGGGLFAEEASLTSAITLTHATLYSNTAVTGAGLYSDHVLTLRNSLLVDNDVGNCAGPGPLVLQGDNVQYPGHDCGLATAADPLLGMLGDHGGGTLTVDLLPGSIALDLAGLAFCPPTDQRGQPRPIGAGCDLGAYERWLDIHLPFLVR